VRGGYAVDLDKKRLENAPSYEMNEDFLPWDAPAVVLIQPEPSGDRR
jgi:hypothetical protein